MLVDVFHLICYALAFRMFLIIYKSYTSILLSDCSKYNSLHCLNTLFSFILLVHLLYRLALLCNC